MKYFFVDESGDFPIDSDKEPYFIMIAVTSNERKELEQVMKRARKAKLSKKASANTHEVKASRATKIFKNYFFQKLISVNGLKIWAIYLDKKKFRNFKNKTSALYLRVLKELLLSANLKTEKSFHLIIDKKPLSGMSTEVLQTALVEEFGLEKDKPKPIVINFDSTPNVYGLHVADFVSWAIFQKYNRNVNEWYEILKEKVVKESELTL